MEERLRFEISPQSFFQVNMEGAKKLYAKCLELATEGSAGGERERDKPVLFDICFGMGTICLCLADKCSKAGLDFCNLGLGISCETNFC